MIDKRSLLGKILSVSIFPVTVATILIAAYYLLQANTQGSTVIAVSSVLALVIIAVFERILPFRQDWNHHQNDVMTDILHNVFSSYASREIYKIIFLMLLAPMVVYLSQRFSDSSESGGLWVVYLTGLPLVIQVFLVAAIADFGNYWVHRLSHETDFFWRFHSIHHSPKRLYWLNAGRDHPVSVLLLYTASSVPLILLGVPQEVLLLYYVLEAVHGLFQHCNIHLRLGPLNWIFSMAELHRWHHSKVVKEANANYGLTLIIWDVIFGTRYLPHDQGPDEIGIDYPNYPNKFLPQMWVPIRWKDVTKTDD